MKAKSALLVFGALTALAIGGCARGINAANQSQEASVFQASSPMVIATTQALNVGTTRNVFVQFSHDMDPSTLTPSTFFVKGVSGTVEYDSFSRIAYFRPNSPLNSDTEYTFVVTNQVRDISGATLPKTLVFAMQTRSTADLSAPTVSLVSTGCISTTGSIDVKFDEPMDSTTINTSTFLVAGVSGTVTYDSITRIASFQPSSPLTAGSSYSVTITTGAKDLGGVALAQDAHFEVSVCPEEKQASFCTFTKGAFAGEGDPGQFFDANFADTFSSDLFIGVFDGSGPLHHEHWSASSTGANALKQYLVSPANGPSTALTTDRLNPTATLSGELSEQVAALTLNVGFSGVGSYPAGFGSLTLKNTGTSLDGADIKTILAMANQALAGNGLPVGYTFSQLNQLITNLNESWDNCTESQWGKDHLQ